MSRGRLELDPAAAREVEQAFEWYYERSLKAAEAFLREIDRGLALISESPRLWPQFEAGTRKYVLRRFPYSILYREAGGRIEVVAVAHQKRRPGYWRER